MTSFPSAQANGHPVARPAQIPAAVLSQFAAWLDDRERDERRRDERDRRIRRAIVDPSALHVVFQPIYDLVRGRVAGLEALSRFHEAPARPPNEWFSEASAAELCLDLELVAARLAVSRLPEIPGDTYLSINVSASSTLEPAFLEIVAASPERIVLEITEHDPVEDYEGLAAALEGFRAAGGRLAVDDAGAGFASLRHILVLEPDFIKLERALTKDVDSGSARRALTKAMVSFAAEIGAEIVAEGIETGRELDTLLDLGVRYGQGYLLGRPGSLHGPLRAAPGG